MCEKSIFVNRSFSMNNCLWIRDIYIESNKEKNEFGFVWQKHIRCWWAPEVSSSGSLRAQFRAAADCCPSLLLPVVVGLWIWWRQWRCCCCWWASLVVVGEVPLVAAVGALDQTWFFFNNLIVGECVWCERGFVFVFFFFITSNGRNKDKRDFFD